MRRKLVVFLMLAIVSLGIHAAPLKVLVIQSEPLGFFEGGQPKGEHYEYMQAISAESGIEMDIQIVPKASLFAMLKSGSMDCAIFFRSAKWDDYVDYVGKIRDIKVIAVNREGKPLNEFSDLYNSNRVAVVADTSISEQFDSDPGINRYAVTDYETMLKVVSSKRVDTATGNAIVLSFLIDKLDLHSKISSDSVTLSTKQQWLQFAGDSANKDAIPKIQAAIETLQSNGTFDAILTKYAGPNWQALNN